MVDTWSVSFTVSNNLSLLEPVSSEDFGQRPHRHLEARAQVGRELRMQDEYWLLALSYPHCVFAIERG